MATSSKPTETGYFPCPTGVKVADHVTLKLCPTNYFAWKQLMVTFLTNQKLIGFINGTISPMNQPTSQLRESWEDKCSMEEEIIEDRELKRREDWNHELRRDSKQMPELLLDCLGEWEWEQKSVEEWEHERQEVWKVEHERREAKWKREREQLLEWVQKLREKTKQELESKMETDQKSQEKGKQVLNEIRQEFDQEEKFMYEEQRWRWEKLQKRELKKEQKRREKWKQECGEKWKESMEAKELWQKLASETKERNKWHRDREHREMQKWECRGEWELGEKRQLEIREEDRKYADWKRSDDLVMGWILATVTEKILVQVIHLKTARAVWIKLKKIFTPPFNMPSRVELIEWTDQSTGDNVSKYMELHKATLTADWKTAKIFLDREPDAVLQPITWCLETALIVAVRSDKRNDFVRNLLRILAADKLEKTDISGATALHAAVKGGNIDAAKWLLEKNRQLANIGDMNGTLAVHLAATLGNREMVNFLLEPTTELSKDESGLKLLHSLASSGLYDIALQFLRQHNLNFASTEPNPLVVIAQRRTSFHSGTCLSFWQQLIYSVIPTKLEDIARSHRNPDIEDPAPSIRALISGKSGIFYSSLSTTKRQGYYFSQVRQKLCALFWDVAGKLVPGIRCIQETKMTHYQALKLVKCLCQKIVNTNLRNAAEIFTEPLRDATCAGIHEIVEEILDSFPDAIHLRSEKDQSLFHMAIVHRRESVFNLIYQMEEDQSVLLSMPDASTNNALHLAGNIAPQQRLLLRERAAGAALQMQRELQWFKEVEKLILPQAKDHLNAAGKTPQEVFTETHQDLVKEGERWMKDTANSCTIVAALTVTIVFAAAITVPGGSNGNGLPIRLGGLAFTLFAIFNALALFSSSASLLMFLSIHTCRYGEQDFLEYLPKRMIIGLAALFISIISMMVAFGATLEIVFGEKKAWVVYPVAVSCCVPITLFAALQFPLLFRMIKSTYFPGMFKKQSGRILH